MNPVSLVFLGANKTELWAEDVIADEHEDVWSFLALIHNNSGLE